EYIDPVDPKKRYIPYVVEPSLGADRVTLAFLCDAYEEEDLSKDGKEDSRVVMHFHPALAPFKAAVLPLSKKLAEPAQKIYQDLAKYFSVDYDQSGSIGKLYRRQDEIGTPYCITVDFDTLEDGCVTVRDRDTMEQTRMPVAELKGFIEEKLQF
ncbi:MAG: glycine--tRNA ligase, partial [Firmicutes bacterium]|nr:glycine--tRNA ligase [Bacillota bacterium]